MNSMIRYFGGKNGISNKILEYFPNDYEKMSYIEPFAGSAALLFHKNRSNVEIINDLDDNIYSLFKVMIDKNLFEKFKNMCDLTPYSEKLLKEYTQSLKTELDIVERAYKYFYCNRVSYNGLGGFSASGVVRRNMSKSVSDYLSSIDGLYNTHDRLSGVVVHNTDALGLIQKWDKENTFIYSDSPYANETRSAGRYKHDMTNDDQDKYLNVLLNIKFAKILISGYNCDRYSVLENNGWKRIDMEIKTQNNNRKGKSKVESLWFNY